jgi:apolipoprotein N-acyltransferase
MKKALKNDWILAATSGILFSLGWPTSGYPLFLFSAFIPLLFLVENKIKDPQKKKLFLKIYLAFFIWNITKTWWVWNATPFGGSFAVIVNSLLMSLVFYAYFFVRKHIPLSMALAFFVSIWISFEKFHLNWDFSWPWLNLGNGFANYVQWIQWYEYTGIFGGTLWILLINVMIFTAIRKYIIDKNLFFLGARGVRILLWVMIPLLFSHYLYSHYQIKGDTAKVLIVQPNLDPWKEKFKYTNEELAQDILSQVTKEADLIIAPETAISQYTEILNFQYTKAYAHLKNYIKTHPGTAIITGVDFIHWYNKGDSIPPTANTTHSGRWYDMYNSAVLIDNKPGFEVYHKSKLVVGAEYTPYARFLKPLIGDFMINLGTSMGSNVTQKEPSVFIIKKGKIKVAPIICYESIYGEYVAEYVKKGANLLAVITNDGWWKNTEGHKQHLSMSRLRAIENRRDVARSANTGISAHINQKGEIVQALDYEKRGSILAKVHLNEEKTFYTIHGDFIARVAIFMAILLFLYSFSKKKVRL